MPSQDDSTSASAGGQGFTWILDHLLTYPGTYELPLRTMYTLNSGNQNVPQQPPSPTLIMGNAFPPPAGTDERMASFTTTAAAQLRANLMSHMTEQPASPTSLPPSFITSFVRKCFSPELSQVDFPQALTALDYLRDLEVRRRKEIVAAFDKLGVDKNDFQDRATLEKKYPGVLQWLDELEKKEKRVEALYTHVYLGLRRWTLINEMSLQPFNKMSCFAMLNTLYPPSQLAGAQFKAPTTQLTPAVLTQQRMGFLKYISAVEKRGTSVLSTMKSQHQRPGEETGWPKAREDLDNYLRSANAVIDECLDITGRSSSPRSAHFPDSPPEEEQKRKVDSGISFGSSGYSSNRSSSQSHATRPSTSSSASGHSRQASKEQDLRMHAADDDDTITVKHAGSALERIARELRKFGSRTNVREEFKARPATAHGGADTSMEDVQSPPPTPGRGLRFKRSIMNIRSTSRSRNRSNSTSRPGSRNGSMGLLEDVPAFDVDEMKRQREVYEAQHLGRA